VVAKGGGKQWLAVLRVFGMVASGEKPKVWPQIETNLPNKDHGENLWSVMMRGRAPDHKLVEGVRHGEPYIEDMRVERSGKREEKRIRTKFNKWG